MTMPTALDTLHASAFIQTLGLLIGLLLLAAALMLRGIRLAVLYAGAVRRFYPQAAAGRRVAYLRPGTYARIRRMQRDDARVVRLCEQIGEIISALDAVPQLRRAMRLALRVKGHAAEREGAAR